VNLGQQDLETSVHDLVNFFRVEFLGHGRVVGHVCKKDGDQLALAFDGTAGGQDFVCQVFGGVGLGLVVIDGAGFGSDG